MIRWIPYAFVRIVLFFMAGICLAIYFPDFLSYRSGVAIFLILVLIYFSIAVFLARHHGLTTMATLKFLSGFVGLTAIFLAGYTNVLVKTDSRKIDHLSKVTEPIQFYRAVVTSTPKIKARSWKIEAAVQSVRTASQFLPSHGNIVLYFSREDFSEPFQYGDIILVKGNPEPVPGPSNPEEFDYRKFLQFKNIFHQDFIKKGNAQKIANDPPSWLVYYALKCRVWADKTIKKHISGEREEAVASALILGVTDALDEELLSAYKATGAMHALAVSGLHVGIVYGLLLFLLKPLQRLKRGDWILAIISIIVLWVYAFITGLSPSVLRAVTMFSFVALARPGAYRSNLYNTLAASAFCILLYDPFLLMSVGFQLSYMAVVGIVYLQSGLYNLWEPANRIVDEIWKVSCVSIAAQIATFTIGLLYFHQFPNYFLLSNLFVIPGSFVVLIAGIALLALDFITPIAIALGFLVEWIIKLLNVIVFGIEQFPFSLIENIYITPWQCLALIGALIAIIFLIERRNFRWLALACTFLLLFSIAQWQHFRNDVHIDKVAIYNVRGHTAIDMIDHGQTFFFADSGLLKDDSKIQYHISPHRIKAGVNEAIFPANAFHRSFPGCTLMTWKGKTFLRIFDKNFRLSTGWQVDYVIVSNNAFTNWFELKNQIQFEKIIFDSSNFTYYVSKALEQMKDNPSKVYSVIHEGAFELLI